MNFTYSINLEENLLQFHPTNKSEVELEFNTLIMFIKYTVFSKSDHLSP